MIRSLSQKLYNCGGCRGPIQPGDEHVVVQYVARAGGTEHSHWHQGQRGDLDAGDDHDVERVIVKSDGPRQESVVDWEDNRRGKDAVQHQKSCLLIELVLSVGSFGDFDDGVDSDR